MKKIVQVCAAVICFTMFGTSTQAAFKFWDIDGATPGAGGATPSGVWDTGTTANWTTDFTGSSAPTTWADNDDGLFSAGSDATGSFVVTLSGNPVVGDLYVQSGSVTISGGTALNIGGGGVGKGLIDTVSGASITIDSVLTGGDSSGSISKGTDGGSGSGTLVLTGQNTYNGQTTVRAGTLTFTSIGNVNGGPSALGNPTNATVGILKIGGQGVGGTLKYIGSGHTTDRAITQAGTTGGATLEASGTGPIVYASTSGITSTGNGIKMLSLTGTNTATNTISGVIGNYNASKYTRVEKRDSGTWALTALNTNSGVYDIREGTLIINSVANTGTPSSVGTGSQGGAHTWIGLGAQTSTNTTLKYIGSGHETDRRIHLWGNPTGGGIIEASGTGALLLQDINRPPSDIADKMIILAGTNADDNTIRGVIYDSTTTLMKTWVTKDGPGKWILTGINAYSGATEVRAGTLLVNGSGVIPAASTVWVNSGGTLGGNGTINGPVTVYAGGTLSPGASVGTLTLGGDLTLAGNLLIEVDKSLSPSNDVVNVTGALNNTGTGNTLTVVNLNGGLPLVAGDSFTLFNKAVGNGGNLAISSAGGEVWTNKLALDGSIAVLSVNAAPPKVPATNLTISAVSPTSINLGGSGLANSAYNVYAATNITTPMTNWWLIGTTNSNGSGLIQYLDSQATNAQRFYRFGQ